MKQTTKKRRPARPATKGVFTKTETARKDNPKAARPATQGGKPPSPEQQSKKDTVIALLRRENGATLDELMSATGWQAHSVRGFISGAARTAMGPTVETAKSRSGRPSYRVVK